MVQATWNGQVLAESDDTVVVDGYTYFPEAAVRQDLLRRSDHHTRCYWKGQADYHDIVVDGHTNRNAAWHYLQPSDQAIRAGIQGRIAFWKGVEIR